MCNRVERICQVDPEGWYAPVIGEELVRCKDCKHWSKPHGWNGWCEHGIPAEADDFCSWAERKEK